jgi:cytidylate kinase
LKKINIAIDGYSSCGKGTLAKELAHELSYLFIDTGAMYRAVTYAIIQQNIQLDDDIAIQNLLNNICIEFKYDANTNYYNTYLNGVNIENEIRTMEVSSMVSPVSKIGIVREELVKQQKKIGESKGVVMDGRDIGTVVFPDAELKLFMTAKPEIRAERRWNELKAKGNTQISFEDVLTNLNQRDFQDSNRENSPLKKAEDAVEIDNSNLTREEQKNIALDLALEKINNIS